MTIPGACSILPRDVEYLGARRRIQTASGMAKVGAMLIAAIALAGCGGAAASNAGRPDAPVAASAPRQTLAFELDLDPGSDCEQAFDLALYQNRAVDLIEWDDQTGACRHRTVRVRFLSNRIGARELGELVRKNSKQARELAR